MIRTWCRVSTVGERQAIDVAAEWDWIPRVVRWAGALINSSKNVKPVRHSLKIAISSSSKLTCYTANKHTLKASNQQPRFTLLMRWAMIYYLVLSHDWYFQSGFVVIGTCWRSTLFPSLAEECWCVCGPLAQLGDWWCVRHHGYLSCQSHDGCQDKPVGQIRFFCQINGPNGQRSIF